MANFARNLAFAEMADFGLKMASERPEKGEHALGEAQNGPKTPSGRPLESKNARGEAHTGQKCPLGGERRAQKWPPGAGPEAKRANFAINLASGGAGPAQRPKWPILPETWPLGRWPILA